MEKPASLRFLDPLVLDNKIEKLAPTCILHDQVELLRCLNNFIKLDYVWVSYQLEDMYLPCHPLNVADILYFLLFEDFNGDFFSSEIVITQLYLSECALADSLAKNIVADVFELRLRLT